MTNREKQIEEIKDAIDSVYGCDCAYYGVEGFAIAEALYDAGYRKRVEGEWNEDIIGFCNVCMSCRAVVDRTSIKNNSGKLNFCPNCGAKMKGGGSE